MDEAITRFLLKKYAHTCRQLFEFVDFGRYEYMTYKEMIDKDMDNLVRSYLGDTDIFIMNPPYVVWCSLNFKYFPL